LLASSSYAQTVATATTESTMSTRVKYDRPQSTKPRSEPAADTSIRPFTINFPDEAITDLRRRIAATRWPDKETVDDDSQGVPLAPMRELARYWASDYDWRKIETRLNGIPQFMTTIDGLDIHFIHVRSKHENALPVIITHGWPGSTIEQIKLIDPLTDPTAHGGTAADAFHVVIPSMPGYGLSEKPTSTGWDPMRIARAWAALMNRLGYTRYVAQGGDWGAMVTELMAAQKPPGLVGMHTNLPAVVPPDVSKAIQSGGPPPAGMSDEEQRSFERLKQFFGTHAYYAFYAGTRPQTLYGLADSPIALAAWMLDHGDGDAQPTASWMAALRRPSTGQWLGELTRDDVLDNITLFWLANTGISSLRLYWENKLPFFDPKHVTIPVAVTVFPSEIYTTPRSWAERAYPKLIYFNRVDKGGHFAALEQPLLFAAEMRAGFKSLR
jgi:pimeloyl-ACP methyl ester carboxylesterase